MDAITYNNRMVEITQGLPLEFAQLVLAESWERGHSAGFSEIILIAEDLAFKLSNVLAAYNKRTGYTNA